MKSLAIGVVCGCLGTSLPAFAWNPPDTSDLIGSGAQAQDRFILREREHGKPVLLAQGQSIARSQGGATVKAKPDTLWLRLIWRDGKIVEARYQQQNPFDPNAFLPLASQYGGGGTWHELADPTPQSEEAKAYPGLMQQWQLEGYGGAAGWAGAGVHHDLFFLVFRQGALTQPNAVNAPLALRDDIATCLDTLSQWMKVSCPTGWPGIPTLSTCYSPVDNPRRFVAKMPLRQQGKLNQSLQKGQPPMNQPPKDQPHWVVLWQEGEGLQDVLHAMQTLPRGEEANYAEDLSRILAAEGRTFLTQAAHANPCLFNQPSWALARLKIGQIPPVQFHRFLSDAAQSVEWLPALQHTAPNCSISVDIAKGGAYRLKAFPR